MREYIIQTEYNLEKSEYKSLPNHKDKSINLAPAKALKILLLIIFFLVLAHIAGAAFQELFPQQFRINTLANKFFDLNNESNFPTYFSAFQLLAASLLLFFIGSLQNASSTKKDKKFWYFLGAVFLFLSFDEATLIHEELVHTLRNRINGLPGFFYYAWVIPYAILVIGVGIYLFKFLFSLPVKIRNLFIISGFLFVFGALGLEVFEGYIEKMHGRDNFAYFALITIEELFEMVSIAIFIYALLSYLVPMRINLFLKDQES